MCTLQSRVSTFSGMFLIGQFFLQLYIALFSNGEHLHGYHPPLSLIIQLLVAGVGYFLKPESGLDSLKKKGQ